MSSRETKLSQAYQAAQLYYMQDRTMAAIASEMGTSRSSVSRLLSFARERGIVDIRLTSPHARGEELEHAMSDRYGVVAHVVPVPEEVGEADRLERVALTAARLVAQFVESDMTVGIAWGSTMSAVSRLLPQKETHGTTIVQLNGAGNTQSTGVDYSSDILSRFGQAFGAVVQQFPVPAFFDDPATRDAMWRERMTKRVLAMHSRMDIAVFGVGSPSADLPSRVYVGGYLDEDDYASLRRDRAVGDVATVFFRADGSWKDVRVNSRATGPDPDRLRHAPRRILIAAGHRKLAAVRGALAARLATDVVVDEPLAAALVAEA